MTLASPRKLKDTLCLKTVDGAADLNNGSTFVLSALGGRQRLLSKENLGVGVEETEEEKSV